MPIISDMSGSEITFPEGLVREIALLGLSKEEFAAKAGISDKTLNRAIRGLPLHSKSFGKILIALGARSNGELVRSA